MSCKMLQRQLVEKRESRVGAVQRPWRHLQLLFLIPRRKINLCWVGEQAVDAHHIPSGLNKAHLGNLPWLVRYSKTQ